MFGTSRRFASPIKWRRSRGKADMTGLAGPPASVANDPMYGPAVRCKKISSSWRRAVLHQCIRLLFGALAPGHHGYQRACDLIKR